MLVAVAAALGLIIGAVIGSLGGGGGVLTVPVLVYVLGRSAQDATTSSVVIVGVVAVAGVLARARGRGVDWRTGIGFGIVGTPAAYLGALLNHRVSQSVLLLAFAALTILAASAMLLDACGRGGIEAADDEPPVNGSGRPGTIVEARPDARRRLAFTIAKVVGCGTVIGFLTGFLGVGGGFLVVPVLVIALRMPIALAIGTSLLIIALNAISSIAARVGLVHLDWPTVVPFTAAAVVGTIIGKRVADRLPGPALTTSFAVMLVAVGLFVGIRSITGSG
jgi:uncharacterized protein